MARAAKLRPSLPNASLRYDVRSVIFLGRIVDCNWPFPDVDAQQTFHVDLLVGGSCL